MITYPCRSALGLAAVSVLAAAALSVIPTSAGAAPTAPTADCATPYNGSADDFASLVNQPVTGLTVLKGTTPGTFHGTVLGVLDQGIDLDTPLIMMQLGTNGITDGSTPTDVDKAIAADGVWEGMSGSPVYTADGQLIGAVSTGLSYGNTDIIGITPATSMVPYLPSGSTAAASQVQAWKHPSVSMQRQLAKVTGISAARAAAGLRPLTGITERGVGAAGLTHINTFAKVRGLHKQLTTGRIAGTTAAAPVDTMKAGGNMADMLVWGDFAEGGIGTVTSVCHGGVIAFGHPLNQDGKTNDALLSASVVFVQPDPLNVSFKAANLGVPAGTISEDVNTAVAGRFGAQPKGVATFRHTASYDGGAARTGVSYSADRNYWIDAAYYAADANDNAVLKSWGPGGGTVAFTVKGTSSGTPFTLSYADRYASSDIADGSLIDMGNVVELLSVTPHVTITNVTTTSVLNDDRTALRVAGVQQWVSGSWKAVNAAHPVTGKAGATVSLRAVITSPSGAHSYQPLSVRLPNKVKGGHGSIRLTGGNANQIPIFNASSVAALKSDLSGATRNDQILVSGSFTKAKVHVATKVKTPRGTRVIGGSVTVPVVVG